MQLVFLYGPAASGKLTVGRELATLTGLPLFHNHLVVDAVAAVFPFGSEPFVALREEFWLRTIGEAARSGQSLIFTFAPEPTVAPDFPQRMRSLVEGHGGTVLQVALAVEAAEQMARIDDESRRAFGKLRSRELLESLRPDFVRCMEAMPTADLIIDTSTTVPGEAARLIAARLAG